MFNFIVGSATPFVGKNPGFSVFTLDKNYLLPINIDTYYMDLPAANLAGRITWEKLHDFLNYYELADMSPANMLKASDRMMNDAEYALKYARMRDKLGPGHYFKIAEHQNCDFECQRFLHCETSTSDYQEWQECRDRDIVDLTDPMSAVMVLLTYPWFDIQGIQK